MFQNNILNKNALLNNRGNSIANQSLSFNGSASGKAGTGTGTGSGTGSGIAASGVIDKGISGKKNYRFNRKISHFN